MSKVVELCHVHNYIKIADLNLHPANPRRISRDRLDAMKLSIVERGFYEPILVWTKDNIVLSGNHRLQAVKELIQEGYTFNFNNKKNVLPVVIEDVDEEQAMAILLETNNHYAEWVDDLLQKAITEAGKAPLSIGFSQVEIDRFIFKTTQDAEKAIHVSEHERVVGGGDDDDEEEKEQKLTLTVSFDCDDKQQELFLELRDRGYKVKA